MSNEMLEVVETVQTNEDGTNPVAPEAVEAVTPPVPELTYEFQPTDESGRLLGGKQVIRYHTSDELAQKLTEQNILLVRKLRETTRKQRLGIGEDENIPDTAPRFDTPVDFTPRKLNDDERVKMSRDLLDPDRFDEATSMLFEATVGVTPEQLRNTLGTMQVNNLRLLATAESEAFVRGTPGYFKCKENYDTITNWMLKRNLAPVRENFQLAYDTLRAAGLLLDAPIMREEVSAVPSLETASPVEPTPEVAAEPTPPNSQAAQELPSRITTGEPAQTRRAGSGVPSGLTRQQATDAGAPVRTSKYTLREIDAMPSELLKKKILGEPGFRELYDRLLEDATKARR